MNKKLAGLMVAFVLFGMTAGSAAAKEKRAKASKEPKAGKEQALVVGNGRKVSFDYTLTVDGKEVDSSKAHGPFQYTHGQQSIIPGLAKQLEGLKLGDEKTVVVAPEEAYGPVHPEAFQEIPRERLPKDVDLKVGIQLRASAPDGRAAIVTVSELKGDKVFLNFNHPLAGKELHFQVKILSVQ